jgi:hypothetical protein
MPTQIVGKAKLALAPFRNERGTLPQELPSRVVWHCLCSGSANDAATPFQARQSCLFGFVTVHRSVERGISIKQEAGDWWWRREAYRAASH